MRLVHIILVYLLLCVLFVISIGTNKVIDYNEQSLDLMVNVNRRTLCLISRLHRLPAKSICSDKEGLIEIKYER